MRNSHFNSNHFTVLLRRAQCSQYSIYKTHIGWLARITFIDLDGCYHSKIPYHSISGCIYFALQPLWQHSPLPLRIRYSQLSLSMTSTKEMEPAFGCPWLLTMQLSLSIIWPAMIWHVVSRDNDEAHSSLWFHKELPWSSDSHSGYEGHKGVARVCSVTQGAKLTFQWREWADNSYAGSIDISHRGPCAVYMKSVSSAIKDPGHGPGWFKIWDSGYDTTTKYVSCSEFLHHLCLSLITNVSLGNGVPRVW